MGNDHSGTTWYMGHSKTSGHEFRITCSNLDAYLFVYMYIHVCLLLAQFFLLMT